MRACVWCAFHCHLISPRSTPTGKLTAAPRRLGSKSEMTLSADDVRAAKSAVERGAPSAPSTLPTPPPMLGTSVRGPT